MIYRDPDPSKLPWLEEAEEFEESPVVLARQSGLAGYAGDQQTYYSDYTEYDLLSRNTQADTVHDAAIIPKTKYGQLTQDVNLQRLRGHQDPAVPTVVYGKPVQDPVTATFRSQLYLDTSQATRNKMRYGKLTTTAQPRDLWGFVTWVEFNNHLSPMDKRTARDYMDQLTVAIVDKYKQTGQYELTYWVAKDEQKRTCPRFYAFSLLDLETTMLDIITVYQGQTEIISHQVKQTKINSITLRYS